MKQILLGLSVLFTLSLSACAVYTPREVLWSILLMLPMVVMMMEIEVSVLQGKRKKVVARLRDKLLLGFPKMGG